MIAEPFNKMTLWVISIVIVGAIIGPRGLNAAEQQYSSPVGRMVNGTDRERSQLSESSKNLTAATTTDPKTSHKVNSRLARSVQILDRFSAEPTAKKSLGDTTNLATALQGDLTAAAGEHGKKYILVKKKPKPKKIKMEVYEPKMKYKKIKMKVPVKTMKKKKVKGYLVKKHHHH